MKNNPIEELLPYFFDGKLSPEQRAKVEQWKASSEKNRQVFADSLLVWEGMEQLRHMKKFNATHAIRQVHAKINRQKKIRLSEIFQKVAALLFLPLILTTLYFAWNKPQKKEPFVPWHTIETPAGMRSEFILPDGSRVYLNSNTRLSYPLHFSNLLREVKLTGEAYFEVSENKEIPFIVNTGRINIEVTGTEFLATSYARERLTEIVLVTGKINLFRGDYLQTKKVITSLTPGNKAIWDTEENRLEIVQVDTEKYEVWKDGILLFRDDPLPDVVSRLNRWFNVDIRLEGPELKDWIYTATFEDETVEQALELLKISAPIEYKIKERKINSDKTFSRMEIIIEKKNSRTEKGTL